MRLGEAGSEEGSTTVYDEDSDPEGMSMKRKRERNFDIRGYAVHWHDDTCYGIAG